MKNAKNCKISIFFLSFLKFHFFFMAEIDDVAFFNLIQKISNGATDLEPLVKELTADFDAIAYSHNIQHQSMLQSNYTIVLQKIDQLIKKSQELINITEKNTQNTESIPVQNIQTPNKTSTEQYNDNRINSLLKQSKFMFEHFISREIPTSGLPYPPLCGSIPATSDYTFEIGDFVAAKFDEDYLLSYIIGFEDDNYIICDADNDNPQKKTVSRNDFIPLPKSLPDRNIPHAEFASGSKVLALWPNDNDEWTSAFYPAIVTSSASDTEYTLQFAGANSPITVKKQFVISARSK